MPSTPVILRGRTASGGAARGAAKIIRSEDDLAKVQRGDVLVAEFTRPEYVTAMALASAIVTEIGGSMCHAAIIAREYGIPCVVAVAGVLAAVEDGQMIGVNADAGTVLL